MKTTKKLLAVILAIAMLFTMSCQSFAVSKENWEDVWTSADGKAGIIMFVGSNETERNFSWYSDAEGDPTVTVSKNKSLKNPHIFVGECIEAIEGGVVNKVNVTDLEENTTYYYQCKSKGFKSEIYSFKTGGGSDFSAMYVTDVHITQVDDENENSLSDTSFRFNETFEDALSNNGDISLILSAGDQATEGLESEYRAMTASDLFRGVSIATAMGNHDRKGVAYKAFKNLPNEDTEASIRSYNGSDYWFVKGDVLFLAMDSNSGNGAAHADFVKRAVEANPDVKWKVMMCHHDLYSGRIPHRESENKLLRMIWGPIADEFGIDLVLLGHSHYYTVTDPLYKNKSVADFDSEMVDPAGTVYMVSCSLGRPRDDEDIGLNDEWIGFDYLTENPTYNILDFTEDSITVNSYELGEKSPFNTFTIKKTDAENNQEISFLTSVKNGFVRGVGAIYTFFNNFSVCSDLKEKGYDVEFSDFFNK